MHRPRTILLLKSVIWFAKYAPQEFNSGVFASAELYQ